ncbi:hypothetical protein HY251_02725 [bacterium]|nr:hypothetical protein [bacterium]
MRPSTVLAVASLGVFLGGGPATVRASDSPVVARAGTREFTAGEVVARARCEAAARGRGGAPLTGEELSRALEALVDDEALWEEGLRRCLDRDDRVVRRLLMIKVYLEDVAKPFAALRPSETDLSRFERAHEAELRGLDGEHRRHEVELRWKLEARRRLSDAMTANARSHAAIDVPGRREAR